MLLSALRRAARAERSGLRVVEHGSDSGAFERPDLQLGEAEARIIEGNTGRLTALPVPAAVFSGFTHFLDGIQRAEVRLYHGPVPIVYGYGAAVVRQRTERRMTAARTGLLEEREALFFPFRLVDPVALAALGIGAEQMVDTSPPDSEPLPLFPPSIHALAAQSVDRWREGLERDVARRWCASAQATDWLLADGTLTGSAELSAHPRAVGLVRSQRTRFFDGEDARTLLGLQAGERTNVFEPETRRWTPVHSWYLRLRDPRGRDVLWSLVRVEVAASPHSADIADRVSGWLLNETAPLATADARWDRLLYPIHDCEQFLRARAPSLAS